MISKFHLIRSFQAELKILNRQRPLYDFTKGQIFELKHAIELTEKLWQESLGRRVSNPNGNQKRGNHE